MRADACAAHGVGGRCPLCTKADLINKPPHYARSVIEPIDAIEAWDLPHHLACVVKYVARAGHKTPDPIEDLQKARWYLDRYIARLMRDHRD